MGATVALPRLKLQLVDSLWIAFDILVLNREAVQVSGHSALSEIGVLSI